MRLIAKRDSTTGPTNISLSRVECWPARRQTEALAGVSATRSARIYYSVRGYDDSTWSDLDELCSYVSELGSCDDSFSSDVDSNRSDRYEHCSYVSNTAPMSVNIAPVMTHLAPMLTRIGAIATNIAPGSVTQLIYQ